MTIYKIHISIDEKNSFWIIVKNGKIVSKNPTNEELTKTTIRSYDKTNICHVCREEKRITDNSILYPGNARREYNKEGNDTGRWICRDCWRRNDPNSQDNIRKSLRKRRTHGLDPTCASAKGDLFEELTCRWRGIRNLNKENDNYTYPIDHSLDPELGIVQTKRSFYDAIDRTWKKDWKNEHHKKFDNIIFYCTSNDGKTIDRVYIFPWEEVLRRSCVTIYKNPSISREIPWYEKYRINDKKTIKKINELWDEINKVYS